MVKPNGSSKVLTASLILTLVAVGVYIYGYSINNIHMYEISKEVIGAGLVGTLSSIIYKIM